jgi:hypothetical protein
MEPNRERVISVSLNEAEWQKFVQLHPQPVVWLRQRIQESIGNGAVISAPAAAGEANTTSATTR